MSADRAQRHGLHFHNFTGNRSEDDRGAINNYELRVTNDEPVGGSGVIVSPLFRSWDPACRGTHCSRAEASGRTPVRGTEKQASMRKVLKRRHMAWHTNCHLRRYGRNMLSFLIRLRRSANPTFEKDALETENSKRRQDDERRNEWRRGSDGECEKPRGNGNPLGQFSTTIICCHAGKSCGRP